jgi:hypothetical protein
VQFTPCWGFRRWSLSKQLNGTQKMKTIHIIKLSIQAALLLASLILCASAAAFSMRSPPRAYRLSLGLAAIALAIMMMGAWAPDPPFWPRMGFAWQFDNGWHIAFDFRWVFVPPLLLAVATCLLVTWRNRTTQYAA